MGLACAEVCRMAALFVHRDSHYKVEVSRRCAMVVRPSVAGTNRSTRRTAARPVASSPVAERHKLDVDSAGQSRFPSQIAGRMGAAQTFCTRQTTRLLASV